MAKKVAKKSSLKKTSRAAEQATLPLNIKPPPKPESYPWKVVLTRLHGEFSTEAAARAAFASAQRGLKMGERLILVRDKT